MRAPSSPRRMALALPVLLLAATATAATVTLRSLVPARHPSVTFTGTLTGGNGRGSDTGQTSYYQMDIPKGLRALNAEASTGSPANTLFAGLVNPAGYRTRLPAAGLARTGLSAGPGSRGAAAALPATPLLAIRGPAVRRAGGQPGGPR